MSDMEGKELRDERLRLGLSQAALARLLGTSPNTVARWERGVVKIGNPEMLRLALRAIGRKK